MIQTNPVLLGNAGESLFWCHGNRILRFNTPPPLRTAEAVAVCIHMCASICMHTIIKTINCVNVLWMDMCVQLCAQLYAFNWRECSQCM